jgi:methyl acetate hydrolase
MDSKLNPIFEKATANNALPGTAAVIVDASGKYLYRKAFGNNDVSSTDPTAFSTSTPLMLWSCTKLVACLAALQLVEQGKLSLEDKASKYVPDISDIPVFDGKDAEGKIKTRPATAEITVRHLFTHSAGFTYDFFEPTTITWRVQNDQTPCTYLVSDKPEVYRSPLLFEPGSAHCYGINNDWLGFIVEKITGQKLEAYVEENILLPLGMKDSRPYFTKGQDRLLVHLRGTTGKDAVQSNPEMQPPEGLNVYGAGHYLVSTLEDYAQIMAMILNKGTSASTGAQILKPATVSEYLFQDQLPKGAERSELGRIVSSTIPMMSNNGSWLPETKLGWSCGFMTNEEDVPGGRKKGSGFWAGLGNLYYWIDPTSGIAGMIGTSLMPFLDGEILSLFESMERVAYGGDGVRKEGDKPFFTVTT